MKKISRACNQSISYTKKRDLTPSENKAIKPNNGKSKEKSKAGSVLLTNRTSGRRSQMTHREIGSKIQGNQDISPLDKTLSNFATTSSQYFRSKRDLSQLISSNSGEFSKNSRKSIEVKQTNTSPRKTVIKSPARVNQLNINEVVSLREASRIKEWASKAKPEIERMWRKVINSSNGIEPYNVVFANYTVFIGKGNNAGLIKKLFASRPWWHLVDTKETANFVWTQWKDSQVLQELAPSINKAQTKEEIDNFPFICSYKAQVATRVYKSVDIENLGLQLIRNSPSYITLRSEKLYPEQQRIHNKMEFNECLTNKNELLATMKKYYKAINVDVFIKIPMTFNVSNETDSEYREFVKFYNKLEANKKLGSNFQNVWIIKPGEFTNRGQGITVCKTLADISAIIKPAESRSYIIQKYIEKPLLVNKRKFDIRCYSLMTSINGIIQGYFYLDGYLRTTSSEYSIKDIKNPFIHLTNDAIQKHSAEYGKFENGNKLSYRDFQRYLDQFYPDKKINFIGNILPLIKDIIKDTMLASILKLDRKKRMHSMEIFGYDFMIDRKFRPWLIEINTNPCLELSSPYLSNLIPAMVENALKISIDSIFPAPLGQYLDGCPTNRFELIFHQEVDGKQLLEDIGENRKLIESI